MEIFKNLTDDELIEYTKKAYNEEIDYIGMEDLSVFSWKNKHLKLTMLKVFWENGTNNMAMFTFAELSDKDEFFYKDVTEETHNIQFETSNNNLERFAYIKKNIIKDAKPLPSSLFLRAGSRYKMSSAYTEDASDLLAQITIIYWGKNFAKNEYLNTSKELSKDLLDDSLDLVTNKYYTDRFHFNEILNGIDNKQFTLELNDCLKAYEQGLWFVCATGIGSVIEHLLYLSLKRLDSKYKADHTAREYAKNHPLKGLSKDPTKMDYINRFEQYDKDFNYRTENHINSTFILRNSIDHYSSGYSGKNICDMMFQGIADFYEGIYLRY